MLGTVGLVLLATALAAWLAVLWEENRTLRDELQHERRRRAAEAQAQGRPVRGANGRYVKAANP